MEKYTDFRTYLDFDLLDIDEEGRESRLSKTISKKSGVAPLVERNLCVTRVRQEIVIKAFDPRELV